MDYKKIVSELQGKKIIKFDSLDANDKKSHKKFKFYFLYFILLSQNS